MCSHVAAILFKVEACNRLELTKQTCTDIPCLWNQTYSKKVNFVLMIIIAIHFFLG